MKKFTIVMASLVCACALVSLTACSKQEQPKTDTGTLSESMQKAAKDTGEAVEKAAVKTGEAVKEAAKDTGEAVEKAAKKADEAVKEATTPAEKK